MKRLFNYFLLFALSLLPEMINAQKTYVVSVGIGTYENHWCGNLGFCEGDAKSIATFFNDHRDSDVFLMLHENATRDHILRVLKNKADLAKETDEIIFVYSGHGYDGGITTYKENEFIDCAEIQDILKDSNAGRKIMFLGSCHSGSFTRNDQPIRARNYKSPDSNVMLYVSSRAKETSAGYAISYRSFFMQRLYEGLNGMADKNGDKKITARELFNYVNPKVLQDSKGKQHPQMYGKFDDDMVIVHID